MGKTDRPKEITLPQVNLEHVIFSDEEDSDEEYIIELGNGLLIITDNNFNPMNDATDSETLFSDDDEEQEVETASMHSELDLFELEWGDSDSNYFIEEINESIDLKVENEFISDTDTDEDSDSDSDSGSESEEEEDDDDSYDSVEEESTTDDTTDTSDSEYNDIYGNFSQSDIDYDEGNDESG